MIAKCIALLAIVAQISASCCDKPAVVLPTCGSCSGSGLTSVVSSGVSEACTSGAITKNVVAKGKYPVALKNCGPTPDKQIPVTTSQSTAPCQEKPTVRLPCNIPAPKCVAHSCTCYKTIIRPRVHQHIITVPTVQRYIETTHKPVVENIQYEAVPVNCDDNCGSGVQMVEVPSGSCSSPVQAVSALSSFSTVPACPVQTVQTVPSCPVQTVQTVPAVPVQTVQTVPAVPVQTVQTVPAVPVQTVQTVPAVPVQTVQAVEVPQIQSFSVPQVQSVEIPKIQTVEIPKVQNIVVPRFQNVEVPQTYSF